MINKFKNILQLFSYDEEKQTLFSCRNGRVDSGDIVSKCYQIFMEIVVDGKLVS